MCCSEEYVFFDCSEGSGQVTTEGVPTILNLSSSFASRALSCTLNWFSSFILICEQRLQPRRWSSLRTLPRSGEPELDDTIIALLFHDRQFCTHLVHAHIPLGGGFKIPNLSERKIRGGGQMNERGYFVCRLWYMYCKCVCTVKLILYTSDRSVC